MNHNFETEEPFSFCIYRKLKLEMLCKIVAGLFSTALIVFYVLSKLWGKMKGVNKIWLPLL